MESQASIRLQQITLGLLRIVVGFLFMAHGAQKLFGVLGSEPAQLMSLRGAAGILEFFGGLLILVGLFTRPVAFILSGQMAVAYWLRHGSQGFWPIENGGELAAFYCFTFLFFWTAGGGAWSLDAWLRRRQTAGSASVAEARSPSGS
jgi:putative oxidoreductase